MTVESAIRQIAAADDASTGTDDELLYELPRARSKGDHERAKVGIELIRNYLW